MACFRFNVSLILFLISRGCVIPLFADGLPVRDLDILFDFSTDVTIPKFEFLLPSCPLVLTSIVFIILFIFAYVVLNKHAISPVNKLYLSYNVIIKSSSIVYFVVLLLFLLTYLFLLLI